MHFMNYLLFFILQTVELCDKLWKHLYITESNNVTIQFQSKQVTSEVSSHTGFTLNWNYTGTVLPQL